MFSKLAERLEDPLHPLLGPTVKGLRTWGLLQSDVWSTRIIYNLLHVIIILFVISQYVELWLIRNDLEEAMRNLSISILSTVTIAKAGTFIFWQKDWKTIITYASALERQQISIKDSQTIRIMRSYTKYSRTITYLYWCLVIFSVFSAVLLPLASICLFKGSIESIKNGTGSYPQIMSTWAPFDKSQGYGYWILFIEHTFILFCGGGILANYDSNAIVLMSFFAGQFKILENNCARLFDDEQRRLDYKVAMKRIKKCHTHHLQLVQNAEMMNSLLSPVMFMYVIICSFMICTCAVQLTTDNTPRMQKMWIAQYLMSLIAQLFMYSWHSTIVMDLSDRVEGGVYASAWWAQEVRVRRSVILLAGQLRRTLIFTAGPFTNLTVSTFVAILKGSYSYYTLLSNK